MLYLLALSYIVLIVVAHVQRFRVPWANRLLLAVNIAFLVLPLLFVVMLAAFIWDWPMSIGGKPSFHPYKNELAMEAYEWVLQHPLLLFTAYLSFFTLSLVYLIVRIRRARSERVGGPAA